MLGDYIQKVAEWFGERPWLIAGLTGFSLLAIAASFFLVPWAIVRIPPDYFVHKRPTEISFARLHPWLRRVAIVAKNTLGVLLIFAGFILALPLVPGPGIVVMLVGLAFVDIPGKRRLECWIASQRTVFSAMNKLRARHGHPPLEEPEQECRK
jgi:hypothetical protein